MIGSKYIHSNMTVKVEVTVTMQVLLPRFVGPKFGER